MIEWIERNLRPEKCNSERFFYDDMESQSGYCLPLIYQEFDITKRGHWCDRGALFDFLLSIGGEGGRLLDFGPGDGWPSLILAPFAREVVGVEGSMKRRQVCEDNAKRMGIANAEFAYAEPGSPMPFADESFDGVTAASSVEQTPDPKATLKELYRVLKPGGRMRIMYEDLDRYRDGREHEIDVESIGEKESRIVVYARDTESETARMFSLLISLPSAEVPRLLGQAGPDIAVDAIRESHMDTIRAYVTAARTCELAHPSGTTLVAWLTEAGFSRVMPTQCGIDVAGDLYENLPKTKRPGDLAGLDRLLRPVVERTVKTAAASDENPPITAVK
ncbi:class I SAM-dependent methyltransferase [Candidatus Eisenbacteria bacterium]|uniref:Class I SAM-dependent methyltransferase n=1 Tax=Eiseniibacteriota bacterium TaxID=2212470 RepID=A0ABV6YPU1_UNCEI